MSDKLTKFINIWEVESHFKCLLVGAMLSVQNHKSILKKCGYDVKNMKPYEYQQIIMSKLHDKNFVSMKVNNFLRNKARKEMVQISSLREQKIRFLWDEQIKAENVGPMMYAIVTCQDTGIELLQDVYSKVHMMAHVNMTQIFDITKKLIESDETLKRKQQKTILDAERKQQMKKRICEIQNLIEPEKSLHGIIHRLKHKINELEYSIETQNKKLKIKEKEKRSLQIKLFSSRSEKEVIQKELQALTDRFKVFAYPRCPENTACSEAPVSG